LILVFLKDWNRRFFGNSKNHTILRISHGHISTRGQNWISHYKLITVPSSKIQCTRHFTPVGIDTPPSTQIMDYNRACTRM
jgi:hypothetical protein